MCLQVLLKMERMSRRRAGPDVSGQFETVDPSWKEQLISLPARKRPILGQSCQQGSSPNPAQEPAGMDSDPQQSAKLEPYQETEREHTQQEQLPRAAVLMC